MERNKYFKKTAHKEEDNTRGRQHVFLLIKPQYPHAGGPAIGLVTFLTGQLALDKVLCFTFSIAVVLCEDLHNVKAFLKIWQIKGHNSEFSRQYMTALHHA